MNYDEYGDPITGGHKRRLAKKRSQSSHSSAISLAHGGSERGSAQSPQTGIWSGNNMRNSMYFCTFQQKYAIMFI